MYWLLNFAMEHIRKNKSTHSPCINETRIMILHKEPNSMMVTWLWKLIVFLPKGIVTLKNSFIALFNS